MRFSTVLSFILAVVLAGAAVFGAQQWLTLERQQISADLQAQQQRQLAEAEKQKQEEPKNTIVVAAEQLGFGEMMVRTKVREIEWSGSIRPDGSFAKIDDLIKGESDDDARFAVTTIAAGEPILASKVTVPGQRAKLSTVLEPGKKAVSIRVNDVLGVAGFVLPGDRVDILLTRKDGGNAYVDVLLQGVRVLAIDQDANEGKDQPSVVRTVTFEMSTEEAQKLVLASSAGTISLALRNFSSSEVKSFNRVTLTDLNEQDVADDLLKQQQASARPEAPDPTQERLSALEALLNNMSEGISARIQGMEEKLDAQEPVVVEKEVVKEVVVEKIVEPPIVIPKSATVGVIRNGRRDEYKVGVEGDETVDDQSGEADLVGANSGNAQISADGTAGQTN